MKINITGLVFLAIILMVLALIIFNDISFRLLGIGIIIIGISLLVLLNQSKRK